MRTTAENAELALLLEVTSTPKPGNVDRTHDHPDLRFEHFVAGAVGASEGLRMAAAGDPIGTSFERAVRGMANQRGGNTQFGALLVVVPLVAAAREGEITPESRGDGRRIDDRRGRRGVLPRVRARRRRGRRPTRGDGRARRSPRCGRGARARRAGTDALRRARSEHGARHARARVGLGVPAVFRDRRADRIGRRPGARPRRTARSSNCLQTNPTRSWRPPTTRRPHARSARTPARCSGAREVPKPSPTNSSRPA